MDFIDQLRTLATLIPKQMEHLQTEEGVKHALVLPFINALGYNVFDPTEVTPEFVCDVGIKKGEKVDYVILKDSKPIILFECKGSNSDLDKEHASQLYRYFSVTESRFGVLTNGIIYKFFTDLEQPNKMDSKPFFEFNMLDIKESNADELKRFTKSQFNLEANISAASELKYTREIKRILGEQFSEPSDEFVRFFARHIHTGNITISVIQKFTDITKRALHQFVNERISDRLKSALENEGSAAAASVSVVAPVLTTTDDRSSLIPESTDKRVVTTQQEYEAFYIVKGILHEKVEAKRLFLRDTLAQCGVLLDDTNRKPICRFRFDGSKMFIGIINSQREEDRYQIKDVNDIYQYSGQLTSALANYSDVPAS